MLFWWIFRDCLMWVRSGGRYALPLCGICSLRNIRIFTIIFVYYWNHFDSKKESNKKKIHKNARRNQKLKSVRFDFYSPPQRTHNIIEMLQLYIVRLRCLIKRRFNWTGAKNSIFFSFSFWLASTRKRWWLIDIFIRGVRYRVYYDNMPRNGSILHKDKYSRKLFIWREACNNFMKLEVFTPNFYIYQNRYGEVD